MGIVELIGLGVILAILGGAVWLGARLSRGREDGKLAQAKDEQLKVTRPDQRELVDKIRGGGF